MKFYLLDPEIAGEIGEQSDIVYEEGKIKEVKFLEYVFSGWQGDELLTTHPCFIVSESLAIDIKKAGLLGVEFTDVKISISEDFQEMFDGVKLPRFIRAIFTNIYEENVNDLDVDFYINKYKEIVVSERALLILKKHKINNCIVEEL